MSDTPKFEVIDRRKMKAEEEKGHTREETGHGAVPSEPAAGPRLVVPESAEPKSEKPPTRAAEQEPVPDLPPAPTAEESREQKTAYDVSAQRLEDLVRAQNPGIGAQPPVGFEH